MALMNMVSHGTQDRYPTFLERDWGWDRSTRRADGVLQVARSRWCAVRCIPPAGPPAYDRAGLAGALLAIPIWAFRRHALLVLAPSRCSSSCRSLGRHPGAHQRARAGRRAGLPAGFAYQCAVAVASQIPHVQALFRRAYRLRADDGAIGGARVRRVRGGATAGPERRGVAFGAAINVYTGRPSEESERKVSPLVMLAAACSHAARSAPPPRPRRNRDDGEGRERQRARYERLRRQ